MNEHTTIDNEAMNPVIKQTLLTKLMSRVNFVIKRKRWLLNNYRV